MSHRYTSSSYGLHSSDTRKSPTTSSSPLSSTRISPASSSVTSSSSPLRSVLDTPTTTRSLAAGTLLSLGASTFSADQRGTASSSTRLGYSRSTHLSPLDAMSSSRGSPAIATTSAASDGSSFRGTARRRYVPDNDQDDNGKDATEVSLRRSRQRLSQQDATEVAKEKEQQQGTSEKVERRSYTGWRSRLLNSETSTGNIEDKEISEGSNSLRRRRGENSDDKSRDANHRGGPEKSNTQSVEKDRTPSPLISRRGVTVEKVGSSKSVEKYRKDVSEGGDDKEELEVKVEETKVRERRAYGKQKVQDNRGQREVVSDIKITTSFYDVTEDKDEEDSYVCNFNRVPINLDNFNRVPINLDNFNRVPINLDNFNRVPINLDNFNRGPINLDNFNRVPINLDNFNRGPINLDNFNRVPINLDNFNRGPINLDNFNRVPIHLDNFNRVPINLDNFNRVPINLDNFNRVPINLDNFNRGPINLDNFNRVPINLDNFNRVPIQST
ncbi:hypothetical protein Btru_048560 [Bulinus truncatus]|nr:hypothetical protein Btru_048560 [Bulinus truncatus]